MKSIIGDRAGTDQNEPNAPHHLAMEMVEGREPRDIRWIRTCLNRWPFGRGKGILLRLFQPRLRNRQFLIEIEPGILIPGELNDWMVLWFFVEGYKKNLPFRLSRLLIHPGDTVVDVGANIGLWVLGAARLAGSEGDVHAFEPVLENFDRLTKNLALNGFSKVKCQQLALSDNSGKAVFYAPTDNNCGLGSLAPRERADLLMETGLITLDDYCENLAIRRVDFMKVDVEGAELLVFRGAQQVLASLVAPIIMFETDETLSARFDSSSQTLKAFLNQFGYDCFRYNGNTLEPVAVQELHPTGEDLFALKPSHFEKHPILTGLYRG
jgi:FkbM family methyltransferase